MAPDISTIAEVYGRMVRIRRFEETVLRLFSENRLFGTTHTCIGQEACAVAALGALDLNCDVVFSNHRCHGHFLMYGGDMGRLFAELMGRRNGVCGGHGGSQHLCWRNFYTNGIQGGIAPLAVGAALAEKRKNSDAVVCLFLGDGTLGQGVVYESLNLAAKWRLPVLFVVEFNRIAQTTPCELTMAGGPEERAAAFGIACDRRPDDDPVALADHMRGVADRVRRQGEPFVQVIETRRLAPHSKGDDTRPAEEIARLWRSDPLPVLRRCLPEDAARALEQEAEDEVRQAQSWAEASPPAAWDAAAEDALAPVIEGISGTEAAGAGPRRVVEALNDALRRILADCQDAFVVGEDLLDPYGGAFKVMRGLSTERPDQVLATPISEAAIVGLSVGAALRGARPVAEVMFGDFLALAADQIVNHAAKFHWVYDHQVTVPMTLRAPMGGRRGYGPTHSQSLEKMFLGVPGLRVVAIHRRHDPGRMLRFAVLADPNPVLFVEHKLLYAQMLALRPPPGFREPETEDAPYPTMVWRPEGAGADFTLVTYGGCAEIAEQAMEAVFQNREWLPEYVLVAQLAPLRPGPILRSVERTRRLVVVEEASKAAGFGAEVLASVAEAGIHARSRRVGARATPVPSSRDLEDAALPSQRDVVDAVSRVMEGG